jgi:transposase
MINPKRKIVKDNLDSDYNAAINIRYKGLQALMVPA